MSTSAQRTAAERRCQAIEAHARAKNEMTISAMPVIIHYPAKIARYSTHKRGEDFIFEYTQKVEGSYLSYSYEEKFLDAYELGNDFEKVKTPTEALDFLSRTGAFTPHDDRFTWSRFLRWQKLASLVREYKQLAAAMSEPTWSGEHGEALKALTHFPYPTTFFEGTDEALLPITTIPGYAELTAHPEVQDSIRRGQEKSAAAERNLMSWFREPPGAAMSIELAPRKDDPELLQELRRGGAMIEFLRSPEQLRPILLVKADCTLHAIAASLWAARMAGLVYQRCPVCSQLFELPKGKAWKEYCTTKCQGTAHSRRVRASKSTAKKEPKKTNRAKASE